MAHELPQRRRENSEVEELIPDSFCTLIKWRDMGNEDEGGTENPE